MGCAIFFKRFASALRSRWCKSLLSSASSDAASLAAAEALARGVLVGPAVAASAGVSATGVPATIVSTAGTCEASWAPRYANPSTLSTQQDSSATTMPIRAGLRFKRNSFHGDLIGLVPAGLSVLNLWKPENRPRAAGQLALRAGRHIGDP